MWALLRDKSKPADNAERLAVARLAFDQKKFAFAARLWSEALTADPKLGDDRQAQYRFRAARAAALAAAGQGQDEPPLDDAAKAKLRVDALTLLQAELKACSKDQPRVAILATVGPWQRHRDLAGLRDAAQLARLPAAEQKAFTQLWADTAELLTKTERVFRALPAAEQIEEVRAELKKRNPAFDGKLRSLHGPEPKIEDGVVTDLAFLTDKVSDVSPVRALTGLRSLWCEGSQPDKGRLSDLSPLAGMALLQVWFASNRQLVDLSPLQGMQLTHVAVWGTSVASLEVVRGMPLRGLWIVETRVVDLSPLAGKELGLLNCVGSRVKTFKGLRATRIDLLYCDFEQRPDETDLNRLAVKELHLSNVPEAADPAILRAPGARLKTINGKSAEEWLKAAGKK
jgi:hypothetical protein